MKNDPQVLARFKETLAADKRGVLRFVEDDSRGPMLQGWTGGVTRAGSFNDEQYTSLGMCCVKTLDRYNTIFEPEGCELDNYRKNPVVLLNHWDFGPNGIPIGMCLSDTIVQDGVLSKTKLAVAETRAAGSNRVAEIWALHRGGYLPALSISAIPHEWEEFQKEIVPGEGEVRGVRFLRYEKLEHSLVTLPGNADALTLSLSRTAVNHAERFGLKLPDTDLPGDLGIISRACRLIESKDLEESLAGNPDGDRFVLSEVERIRKTYRLSPQPDWAASAASVTERLQALGAEIRSLLN